MRVIDNKLLQRVDEYIRRFQVKEGRSPTQRNIMTNLKMTAPRVHKYIHVLVASEKLSLDHNGAIEMPTNLDSSSVSNVPLLGMVRCGEPTLAIEDFYGMFKIPVEFTGTGNFFMLRAKGDSMVNAGIYDGDYLVIREQCVAMNGDIVVAIRLNEYTIEYGEATLKRLMQRDGKFVLHPENEVYADLDANEYKIIGKLIGFYRKFSL